jgi:serine protease inhibitor
MSVFRALRQLLTLAAVAALAGCGQPPGQPRVGEPEALTLTGVSRQPAAADAPVDATVAGLGRFADQFRAAVFERGQNAVFSPLSIGYAFAMLRAAAAGQTAAQLDRLFGFPGGVHQAYNALTGQIVTAAGPPPRVAPGATRDPAKPPAPPIVAIANGLFLRSGFRPSEAFLRILAEQYGAEAQAVDFGSDQAAQVINAWVRQQTAGRIDRLFDSLAPDTVTVIANAVYLKADWQHPFGEGATRQQPFRRADGSTVQVPMMHPLKMSDLQYAAGTGWQAVELPYARGELAMWVLVPAGDQAPDRLLAPEVLDAARSSARPAGVDLAMPRWDFGTDVDLLAVVGRLGLTDLGDLPGIAPDAFVGAAVHRANISVDEWGTEAAAVTGLRVTLSAGPQPEVVVHADHPFAFAIVHRATGTPLFLGQVADPTQR